MIQAFHQRSKDTSRAHALPFNTDSNTHLPICESKVNVEKYHWSVCDSMLIVVLLFQSFEDAKCGAAVQTSQGSCMMELLTAMCSLARSNLLYAIQSSPKTHYLNSTGFTQMYSCTVTAGVLSCLPYKSIGGSKIANRIFLLLLCFI